MARLLLLTAVALGAAASATTATFAQTPSQGGDRYGPAPNDAQPGAMLGAQGPASARAAMPIRMLGWPGKVETPVAVTPPQAAASSTSAYTYVGRTTSARISPRPVPASAPLAASTTQAGWTPPPPRAASARPEMSASAPSDGWRPVFAAASTSQTTSPATPQTAPTSIYDPPRAGGSPTLAAAAAAPPNRALAADRRYGYDPTQNHSVRVYSVARPFGLKPDPAPIPPQFFTATADLGADPPGPLPLNHTTATTRAAVAGGDSNGQ